MANNHLCTWKKYSDQTQVVNVVRHLVDDTIDARGCQRTETIKVNLSGGQRRARLQEFQSVKRALRRLANDPGKFLINAKQIIQLARAVDSGVRRKEFALLTWCPTAGNR